VLVPDVFGAAWRKSSRSNGAQNCVELAHVAEAMAVRDSKNPTGPVLAFSAGVFGAFLRSAKRDG
jgi:uncharacterized protein DUF397